MFIFDFGTLALSLSFVRLPSIILIVLLVHVWVHVVVVEVLFEHLVELGRAQLATFRSREDTSPLILAQLPGPLGRGTTSCTCRLFFPYALSIASIQEFVRVRYALCNYWLALIPTDRTYSELVLGSLEELRVTHPNEIEQIAWVTSLLGEPWLSNCLEDSLRSFAVI